MLMDSQNAQMTHFIITFHTRKKRLLYQLEDHRIMLVCIFSMRRENWYRPGKRECYIFRVHAYQKDI